MPINQNPHSSWAEVYDQAYDKSFGKFYQRLTDTTIQAITDKVKCDSRIVDFGAGTGRLSIPLAEIGFDVTAVDVCSEMLYQLEQKKANGMKLQTVCSKMEDFKGNGFDFALCVFTVLLYLLDEESLNNSLLAAHRALNNDGMLLIDIPSKVLFKSYSRKDDSLERIVSVTQSDDNIYDYREMLKLKGSSGDESTYSDAFKIR